MATPQTNFRLDAELKAAAIRRGAADGGRNLTDVVVALLTRYVAGEITLDPAGTSPGDAAATGPAASAHAAPSVREMADVLIAAGQFVPYDDAQLARTYDAHISHHPTAAGEATEGEASPAAAVDPLVARGEQVLREARAHLATVTEHTAAALAPDLAPGEARRVPLAELYLYGGRGYELQMKTPTSGHGRPTVVLLDAEQAQHGYALVRYRHNGQELDGRLSSPTVRLTAPTTDQKEDPVPEYESAHNAGRRPRRPGPTANLAAIAAPVAHVLLFPRYAWLSLLVFVLAVLVLELRRLGALVVEAGKEISRG